MFDTHTDIQATNINWVWRETPYQVYSREPVLLKNRTLDASLDWGDNTVNIELYGYDNVGSLWSMGKSYIVKAEIVNGTGTITDGLHPGVYGTSCLCYNLYDPWDAIHWPIWRIRYKRDNLVTDESPQIEYKLIVENEVKGFCSVILFDEDGNPM